MNSQKTTCVGLDIAQATITHRGPNAATIENNAPALAAYLQTLPPGSHLICEATGRHHHELARACAKKQIPLTILNPAQARAYARSHGKLEKTDPIDAALLRQYGEERRPKATPLRSPERQNLLDLAMIRRGQVRARAAHRQRLPAWEKPPPNCSPKASAKAPKR